MVKDIYFQREKFTRDLKIDLQILSENLNNGFMEYGLDKIS